MTNEDWAKREKERKQQQQQQQKLNTRLERKIGTDGMKNENGQMCENR